MSSAEQTRLMQEWYENTGFEFMGCDEVKADDPAGFVRAWRMNCQWLQDVVDNMRRKIDSYNRAEEV